MDSIVFEKNYLIVSFRSKDGEQIDFAEVINPTGISVEIWCKTIETVMIKTMQKNINNSIWD